MEKLLLNLQGIFESRDFAVVVFIAILILSALMFGWALSWANIVMGKLFSTDAERISDQLRDENQRLLGLLVREYEWYSSNNVRYEALLPDKTKTDGMRWVKNESWKTRELAEKAVRVAAQVKTLEDQTTGDHDEL